MNVAPVLAPGSIYWHLPILIVVVSLVYSRDPLRSLGQHHQGGRPLGPAHAHLSVRNRIDSVRTDILHLTWDERRQTAVLSPPLCRCQPCFGVWPPEHTRLSLASPLSALQRSDLRPESPAPHPVRQSSMGEAYRHWGHRSPRPGVHPKDAHRPGSLGRCDPRAVLSPARGAEGATRPNAQACTRDKDGLALVGV